MKVGPPSRSGFFLYCLFFASRIHSAQSQKADRQWCHKGDNTLERKEGTGEMRVSKHTKTKVMVGMTLSVIKKKGKIGKRAGGLNGGGCLGYG